MILYYLPTASAAGEKISPYLTEILDLLRDNLKTLNSENEKDLNNVHTQALGKFFIVKITKMEYFF